MWDGRLFYKNRGWRCGTHHFCLMRATTVAFLLLPFLGAAQGVLINEVAPGEQDGPDWVELHNSGRHSVDLNGATFVSGDALHRVDGALVVPAGGSVVLWFGGDGTGVSHVPFKLSRKGDALMLVAPDRSRVLDVFSWPDLPAGMAIGRSPDGGAHWGYTQHPTPGGPAHPGDHARRLLAAPLPVMAPNGLDWTAPEGAALHYTLDGSVPGPDDPTWTGPRPLPSEAVITVRAIADDAVPSPCASYPPPDAQAPWSISLRADPRDLTDSVQGILVEGAAANFSRRGRAWERPAEIALHMGDTCVRLPVEVWVAGSGSRSLAKKSLKLRLQASVDTALLPPALRGAQEWLLRADATPGAFVHDHFMERLAKEHAAVEVQGSIALPLLVNGTYHGLYRLMPAKNGDLVRTRSACGEVDVVTGPAGEVITGDRKAYRRFMEALTGAATLEELAALADLESLLDMACLDLWTGRVDAELNTRCWRPRTKDGRWRWILFDMDLWAPPEENTVARMQAEPPQAAPHLPALLSDEARTNALLARATAWHAAGLWGTEARQLLEDMHAHHRNAMLRDHARWSGQMPMEHPDSSFARLERHLSTRAPNLLRHLSEATGRSLERMELRVRPEHSGELLVEGRPVTDAEQLITAFMGAPVHVTALARPGYRFVGWRQGTDEPAERTAMPGRDRVLTAVFRPVPPSGGDRLEQ